MKKVVLVIVFGLVSQAALGQVQVAASNARGGAGSKVSVPITVSEGRDIVAIQFVVTFDAAVLSVPDDKSVTAGDLVTDHSLGASRAAGKVTTVIFSGSLSPLKAGSGAIANVVFQIAAGAASGATTKVQITSIQASDANGDVVATAGKEGTITIGSGDSAPGAGVNELVFSQIVNGSFSGGSYVTSMVFVNRTASIASGEIRFVKSDGTPLVVKLSDGRTGSSFPFTLAEGGSVFLKTDGSGTLAVGYARVISTGPIGGTLLFSQLDTSGSIVSEAGVGTSPLGTRFSVPVFYRKGADNTGIAFVNLSTASVEITLTLREKAGGSTSVQKISLAPGQHVPKFATEFFSVLESQNDFQGSIEISAPQPVAAVALKLLGPLITTFPVVQVQ